MKKGIKISMVAAVMVALMGISGCKKDSTVGTGSSKLSPPSWIHGSWGEGSIEIYKFTPNDVFFGGVSLKTIWGIGVGGTGTTLKETKNTGSLYEITVTAKVMGKEMASACYSFRKGDGTYIEAAADESGATIRDSDYSIVHKMN